MSLPLGPGEVHVWRIALDQAAEAFRGLLAVDEQERASRFRVERGADRYTVGRGALRTILARYTGTPPEALVFRYNQFGKPELEASGFCFNLSHSHELALAAVARGRAVGVDIERIREQVLSDRIAERFFAPAEARVLAALPPEQQPQAFFHCWTRKEAWIKARGEGLSIPLSSFEVSFAPGEPARLLATRPDEGEAAQWTLRDLPCERGFAAALAVAGEIQGNVSIREFRRTD